MQLPLAPLGRSAAFLVRPRCPGVESRLQVAWTFLRRLRSEAHAGQAEVADGSELVLRGIGRER